jgi:hypothetical protein
MDAIAKSPKERPASMAAFAERLKQVPLRPLTAPIVGERVLTHARPPARPVSAPMEEPASAPTETAYQLGGAADDEEGFALGTGSIRLGEGFEMGDDEPWSDDEPWAGHHDGSAARESFRLAPLAGMLIVLGVVLGIGLAIRAIDRNAAVRAGDPMPQPETVSEVLAEAIDPAVRDGSGAQVVPPSVEPAAPSAPSRHGSRTWRSPPSRGTAPRLRARCRSPRCGVGAR